MVESIQQTKCTVLSLNMHGGLNFNGKYDLDGLIKLINKYQPDIVGLQEVGRKWLEASNFADIPGELALKVGMFPAFSVSLERQEKYFGNLILSRFPILQSSMATLPGALEKRSYVWIKINFLGSKVNFLVTHLGLSKSDRYLQATRLLELLKEEDEKVIIMGDFNEEDTAEVVGLFKAKYIDFQEKKGLKSQGTIILPDGSIGARIDYIFGSPIIYINNFWVLNEKISDHLPMLAEVFIKNPLK